MEKLLWLTTYFLVNCLFFWLRKRPVKHYSKTRIDNKIPFISWAVVPYISYYFLYILAPVLLLFSPYFNEFARVIITGQLIASLIWYFFPNGMLHPEVVGNKRTDNWVRWIYRYTRNRGCAFPSTHTYHSLIMGTFLVRVYPQWQAAIAVWAAMIVCSTVFTKQHYVADVAGGAALSVLALKIS